MPPIGTVGKACPGGIRRNCVFLCDGTFRHGELYRSRSHQNSTDNSNTLTKKAKQT